MAKRRRRIKIKNSSLFAFIILNLLIASGASHHYNRHQHQDYRTSSQQFVPAAGLSSTAHLCSLLPAHVSRHLKLCKLISHSPSADEAVALGATKGLAECQNQLKAERWNCTHAHGDHHLLTSELAQSVGTRESGFVQAIAAAGIVHSVATACSVGTMSDCSCDKSRIGSYWHMDEKWKWGGCSNNIRHGMLFAKHLVELLDAVHQHSHSGSQHHLLHEGSQVSPSDYQHQHHKLQRRSLSSRHREPNQLRGRQSAGGGGEPTTTNLDQAGFCQRNHNISQAAHFKLIKSLLSANSLERHQEFRLAMNMHNNKVGRMAVAKNMEFRCRCHGLSGSCSLKTCWLLLPNFQIIGSYLKRKYEASVHLPTAVDVNKLIPMMNRDEISAILSNRQDTDNSEHTSSTMDQQVEPQAGAEQLGHRAGASATSNRSAVGQWQEEATAGGPPLDYTAHEVQADEPAVRRPLSGHFIVAPTSQPQHNQSGPINVPTHYSYYERHRQLQAESQSNLNQQPQGNQTLASKNEIPVNVAPLSQQQYQALLRDMRLCNTTTTTLNSNAAPTGNGAAISYLATRDLKQQQQQQHQLESQQLSASVEGNRPILKKLHNNNYYNQQVAAGQTIRNANQHLSQLLQHSNKDELIHLHRSPDFCEADLRHGYVGIQARVCSDNPLAPNSCDKLCCGRGYSRRIHQYSYKCDCKFQYCCSINCSTCEKETKWVECN